MEQTLFCKILPFVRYVHQARQDVGLFAGTVVPYDHRLFFLRRGSCCLLLGNGEEVTLLATDLLYIPAGHAYRWLSSDAETDLVAVNFDFFRDHAHLGTPIPPVSQEQFDGRGAIEQPRFLDAPAFENYLLLRRQSGLLELFRSMEEETASQKLFYGEHNSAYLRLILSHMARLTQSGNDSGGDRIVDEVIALVRQCYAQPISNREIAERLNYHPNYLNRLMLQHTGRTLHQYLLQYRFDHAIALLTLTDLPISEVATRSGFADLSHFSRTFRRITGQSPGGFRHSQTPAKK